MKKILMIAEILLILLYSLACATDYPEQDSVTEIKNENYLVSEQHHEDLVEEYVQRFNRSVDEEDMIHEYKSTYNEMNQTYTLYGPGVLITLVNIDGRLEPRSVSADNAVYAMNSAMNVLREYRDSQNILPEDVEEEIAALLKQIEQTEADTEDATLAFYMQMDEIRSTIKAMKERFDASMPQANGSIFESN